LDEYDIPPEDYEIMNIENMRDCSEIQDYMMELTGGRTVIVKPFINNVIFFRDCVNDIIWGPHYG